MVHRMYAEGRSRYYTGGAPCLQAGSDFRPVFGEEARVDRTSGSIKIEAEHARSAGRTGWLLAKVVLGPRSHFGVRPYRLYPSLNADDTGSGGVARAVGRILSVIGTTPGRCVAWVCVRCKGLASSRLGGRLLSSRYGKSIPTFPRNVDAMVPRIMPGE